MKQTQLIDFGNWWFKVEEKISLNHRKRINWVSIFGKSLTKKIAELYGQGRNPIECYWILEKELRDKGFNEDETTEFMRRIEIGIAARFGEIQSETKEINKQR